MGCHAQLNPLGFALEEFDPLARHRGGVETIFSLQAPHNSVASLPLDLEVVPRLGANESTIQVRGVQGLAELIVSSGRGESCLARKYFTYTFRRSEDVRQDGCALNGMANLISHKKGGTLKDFIVRVAYLPEFRNYARRGAP
jgi:hypothetical protein